MPKSTGRFLSGPGSFTLECFRLGEGGFAHVRSDRRRAVGGKDGGENKQGCGHGGYSLGVRRDRSLIRNLAGNIANANHARLNYFSIDATQIQLSS